MERQEGQNTGIEVKGHMGWHLANIFLLSIDFSRSKWEKTSAMEMCHIANISLKIYHYNCFICTHSSVYYTFTKLNKHYSDLYTVYVLCNIWELLEKQIIFFIAMYFSKTSLFVLLWLRFYYEIDWSGVSTSE